MQIAGVAFSVCSVNTLIVGSGAAGLNAALQLHRRGVRDIIIATERWGAGASFEAGSDKQTYYKLSLAHGMMDCPRKMAEDLSRGGCMHGDIALCEAQHSAEAFYHLVELGVPFPHDEYGAYVAYRTDHDPAVRATSAGPLTSRLMCDCLGREVREKGIGVLDNCHVVSLLTRENQDCKSVCGAMAIEKEVSGADHGTPLLINAVNVILATGGPGGMYRDSVYPESQMGSTGLALAVGATAHNLTESQFGLASIDFRWNLSGSYQQAIPRYISTDKAGGDEREFLNEYFPDMTALATAIFLKGYEWPFDCNKVINGGSSLIDVLVYQETVRHGRRVFLDYTGNPVGGDGLEEFSLRRLNDESHEYLEKSNALRPTPIERLRAINEPAYNLYRKHDIDLARQRLEIAVCAQHNNGGLKGNIWWESNILHLFPVGEVNGSHGVRRPGGSALNAGQVGGIRAAMMIASKYGRPPPNTRTFVESIDRPLQQFAEFIRQLAAGSGEIGITPEDIMNEVRERMSACAGIVRDLDRVEEAAQAAWNLLARAKATITVASCSELASAKSSPWMTEAKSGASLAQVSGALRALDMCLTHAVYLEALREYLALGGGSRGSFMVLDRSGESPHDRFGDEWRFRPDDLNNSTSTRILELKLDRNLTVDRRWTEAHPVPDIEPWFESVWSDYRHGRVIG